MLSVPVKTFDTQKGSILVQVDLSTFINTTPTNYVFVIDVSGSMAIYMQDLKDCILQWLNSSDWEQIKSSNPL